MPATTTATTTDPAQTERTRILLLLDELVAHYSRSAHPGLTRGNRSSVLWALRLLRGRIEGGKEERN